MSLRTAPCLLSEPDFLKVFIHHAHSRISVLGLMANAAALRGVSLHKQAMSSHCPVTSSRPSGLPVSLQAPQLGPVWEQGLL